MEQNILYFTPLTFEIIPRFTRSPTAFLSTRENPKISAPLLFTSNIGIDIKSWREREKWEEKLRVTTFWLFNFSTLNSSSFTGFREMTDHHHLHHFLFFVQLFWLAVATAAIERRAKQWIEIRCINYNYNRLCRRYWLSPYAYYLGIYNTRTYARADTWLSICAYDMCYGKSTCWNAVINRDWGVTPMDVHTRYVFHLPSRREWRLI